MCVCVFCFKLLLLNVHLCLTVCRFVHACARVCYCWCELTIPAGSTCASCPELMDWATHMLWSLTLRERRRGETARGARRRRSAAALKVSVILHWCRGWNTSNCPQRFRLSATIVHLRLTVQLFGFFYRLSPNIICFKGWSPFGLKFLFVSHWKRISITT